MVHIVLSLDVFAVGYMLVVKLGAGILGSARRSLGLGGTGNMWFPAPAVGNGEQLGVVVSCVGIFVTIVSLVW